ncbi:MAG TPA: dihydropteroate synthase [Candidatus Acidoferrum sp.]|nr:dihydropteroate synthase [Candidatus Acidoferrum sp.]
MGALNVSPESFHSGSVYRETGALVDAAMAMVEAGAALIDVGARSTAPYLETEISEEEETRRLAGAVQGLAAKLAVPVSVDTCRPGPARAAFESGARVLNDVRGLRDPALARLAAEHEVGVIAMAWPESGGGDDDPGSVAGTRALLAACLERARRAGIPEERVVLDPGIGFFREGSVSWDRRDVDVLAGLRELMSLGRPMAVGVSRKSFIGAITGRTATADRLAGSLSATALAVANGAALIRTHDVAETVDAVRVAERILGASDDA